MAKDAKNDDNPFISDAARRLYDEIVKNRKQQLELADRINEYTAKAQEDAQESPASQPEAQDAVQQKPEGNVIRFVPLRPAFEKKDITLIDVLDWYQNKDDGAVRGQEKALIKATLKAVMLNSFALEGPSGRGKTHLLKALVSVIPEDKVYWYEFATDTTLFNKAEEINKYQILVIPEYQKILKSCPMTREVIKTITEGRVAKREKTAPDGTIKQYLFYPKCVITSIADENEFKEVLDKDKEDMRRFSHIKVDTSFDTTQKIREYKRQKRSIRPELRKVAPESLGERIKEHLSGCIGLQLESPALDPFAEYMDQYLPITDKSIAYVDDYYSYLDGCAKFHYRQRVLKNGRDEALVLDLADHFIVYQIYHSEFCDTLLKLDNLESFGDRGQKALEPVNWAAVFEAGVAKMRENYPKVIVDKWIERQLKDKKLIVPDVLKQEEVALFEYE
ncbi:MAG: hypothetical protein QXM31_03305 [Candidatus Woesearchaeota archaeon]